MQGLKNVEVYSGEAKGVYSRLSFERYMQAIDGLKITDSEATVQVFGSNGVYRVIDNKKLNLVLKKFPNLEGISVSYDLDFEGRVRVVLTAPVKQVSSLREALFGKNPKSLAQPKFDFSPRRWFRFIMKFVNVARRYN